MRTVMRTTSPRKISIETKRDTMTANDPLAVTGVRGRETEKGETGLSVTKIGGGDMLEHA